MESFHDIEIYRGKILWLPVTPPSPTQCYYSPAFDCNISQRGWNRQLGNSRCNFGMIEITSLQHRNRELVVGDSIRVPVHHTPFHSGIQSNSKPPIYPSGDLLDLNFPSKSKIPLPKATKRPNKIAGFVKALSRDWLGGFASGGGALDSHDFWCPKPQELRAECGVVAIEDVLL